MKNLILPFLLLASFGAPAQAGRNQNGALVVHTNDEIIYTPDWSYCDTPPGPTDCEALNPNGTHGLDTPQLIWLLAAFRPEASPGVTAIQFGIRHNLPAGQGYFPTYSACGPSPVELQDAGWPDSGFGNLVAFGSPVYDHVFRFYFFTVYIDGPDNYLGTRTYPSTNEAKFVDDGNPPVEDLCVKFGTMRWDGTGRNDCPNPVPPGGACCFCDGHCLIQSQAECWDAGGTYYGDDTACDPNPCSGGLGACCFPDGRCTIADCVACPEAGGVWQGVGTSCTPNPCPPPAGACCFPNGDCTILTLEECATQNGNWQGVDTGCTPNPCEALPGACCFPSGDCRIMVPVECDEAGGAFQGPLVLCIPNPCPQTPQACCFPDDHCELLMQEVCWQLGGHSMGYGTLCEPNPCPQPPAACCHPDGSCTLATPRECEAGGGTPQGDGTDCDPNPCPPPGAGACCLDNASCIMITLEECSQMGGAFLGENVSCEPNPCGSSPIERTTWGKLKAIFR